MLLEQFPTGFDPLAELKNERDYVVQTRAKSSMGNALEWAVDEIERLRKIEVAARALKFSAYPAHGSGFVIQVHGGNINDLEAALNSQAINQ